jgi:8-oxo-dGTP diphosphatase
VDLAGGYRVHDFAATVTGGALTAGDDASDARWFTAAELADLELSPGLIDELRKLAVIPSLPAVPRRS